MTTGNWENLGEVVDSTSAAGEVIEIKMPLSVIGYAGELTLNSVRPMGGAGGLDWYAVDETSPVEVLIMYELDPASLDGEAVSATEQPRVCASEIVSPIPFGKLEPAPFQFSGPGFEAEWFVAPGTFNMPHEIMLTSDGELLVLSVRSQVLVSLKRAQLDMSRYALALVVGDFFSPHLFVLHGVTEGGDTFARHFGLPPDTMEDPFTGSATGGMAAYLWNQGLLDQPKFVAQQGHWMGRPGEAYVEVIGPRDAIETVKVGGYAAKVMRGEILAPDGE